MFVFPQPPRFVAIVTVSEIMIVLQKYLCIISLSFPITNDNIPIRLKHNDYKIYSYSQPKFKNTFNYNTISAQELLEINNEKILHKIMADSILDDR